MGKHGLLNLYGCHYEKLNDTDFLLQLLKDAAYKSGATYVDHCVKKFDPHGVTIVILLSESHISIHTWPENGQAAIDIFTCGEEVDPFFGVPVITSKLLPTRYTVEVINR